MGVSELAPMNVQSFVMTSQSNISKSPEFLNHKLTIYFEYNHILIFDGEILTICLRRRNDGQRDAQNET